MSSPGVSPRIRPSAADTAAPDADALVRAFEELRDELLSTLLYVLGHRDDAHDAAQNAFLKCWRARGDLDRVQNLRAWIFRVALNAARDLQRNAWRRRSRPLLEEAAMFVDRESEPGRSLEEREDLARLRQAIGTLRHEEQEVFLLRQNGGLTYEQIAEIRQAPVGTVKTQMRSALAKLRAVLT